MKALVLAIALGASATTMAQEFDLTTSEGRHASFTACVPAYSPTTFNAPELSERAICHLNAYKSEKTGGVHGAFAWARINGKIYSVQLSAIRGAADVKEAFAEAIGAQVEADLIPQINADALQAIDDTEAKIDAIVEQIEVVREVERLVEVLVEVEVPVETIVERVVEVLVDREVRVEVPVETIVERIVEREVEVIREVEVEVPVEVEVVREVEVEVVREVEVEVVREVEVEVIREVEVDRIVETIIDHTDYTTIADLNTQLENLRRGLVVPTALAEVGTLGEVQQIQEAYRTGYNEGVLSQAGILATKQQSLDDALADNEAARAALEAAGVDILGTWEDAIAELTRAERQDVIDQVNESIGTEGYSATLSLDEIDEGILDLVDEVYAAGLAAGNAQVSTLMSDLRAAGDEIGLLRMQVAGLVLAGSTPAEASNAIRNGLATASEHSFSDTTVDRLRSINPDRLSGADYNWGVSRYGAASDSVISAQIRADQATLRAAEEAQYQLDLINAAQAKIDTLGEGVSAYNNTVDANGNGVTRGQDYQHANDLLNIDTLREKGYLNRHFVDGVAWQATASAVLDAIEDAYNDGYSDGYDDGYTDGYADGFRDGAASVQ